jgi:tetratricopeptide (TPR) repeat protein
LPAVKAASIVLIESQGGSDENRADVHLRRGSMYRRLGKYELALADFSESIRYSPKSADAYTGRGNAYRGLHQPISQSPTIARPSVSDPTMPLRTIIAATPGEIRIITTRRSPITFRNQNQS